MNCSAFFVCSSCFDMRRCCLYCCCLSRPLRFSTVRFNFCCERRVFRLMLSSLCYCALWTASRSRWSFSASCFRCRSMSESFLFSIAVDFMFMWRDLSAKYSWRFLMNSWYSLYLLLMDSFIFLSLSMFSVFSRVSMLFTLVLIVSNFSFWSFCCCRTLLSISSF